MNAWIIGGHMAAGSMALVAFWMAASMRKGGRAHRRAGRIYLVSLLGILASVVPMIVTAPNAIRAVRLCYLMLIVTTAIWIALRAIRDKARPERFTGPVFRVLASAMGALGAFFMAVAICERNALVVGFASIGLVYGTGMWWFALRGPTRPHWWLGWHFNGICLLFAATHDSFLSLGMRSVLPQLQGPVMRTLVLFTILGLAIALRLWLGHRYLRGPTRGASLAPAA